MTTDRKIGSRRRPRTLGAAAALLLMVTACSSTDVEAPLSTTSATPPASSAAVAVTTSPPKTTTSPPEPSSLLGDALALYAAGYGFVGTATVDGVTVSTISGRWQDDATEMTIDSGDGTVEYVITADGQWARLPGGTWEELDGTPPAGNPLEVLGAPASLDLVTSGDGEAVLQGIYPAVALGLKGDPVRVELHFTDGMLTAADYTVDIEGTTAGSATTFTLPTNTAPITAPTS